VSPPTPPPSADGSADGGAAGGGASSESPMAMLRVGGGDAERGLREGRCCLQRPWGAGAWIFGSEVGAIEKRAC